MTQKSVVLVLVLGVTSLSSVSALKCFTCSGDTCTSEANMGSVVDCPENEVSCFAQFTGFLLTRRGCWSELNGAIEDANCAGGDCSKCDTDYCNGLSRTNHRCVTCSSVADERCTSNPAALELTQCGAATLDVALSQCYTRVIGKVTERGCVQSEQAVEACIGPMCGLCIGEGCNNEEFPAGRQKCVSCSGAACNAADATGYCELPSDNCVTVQKNDGTYVKNCENAMAATDVTFCQANPTKCSYCGLLECNKGVANMAASRKCYQCEGTGCLQTSVDIKTCHNADDVCFSMFDGLNPIRRGCRSQLSEPEKAQCDSAEDTSCGTCQTDACNLDSNVNHKCQYCSSVYDNTCITAPNREVRCPAPTTEVSSDAQCYTKIIGSVTERGCLGSATDALECDSAENCQTCAGQSCNKGVFPADRIKCVVGTAADQYCPNPADNCVQIANSGATITKKCQSSMTTAEVSFCKANSNKCYFCWGNNCNQQSMTFNYLECFRCQSSTDYQCTNNPTAIAAFDHCTTCATVLSATTNTLTRGCLSGLTAAEQAQCTAGDSSCSTCTTNRCNGAIFPQGRLSCYQCSEGECHSHDRLNFGYCPNYRQDDSCITRLDSSGKVLWMGCQSSLSTADATACTASGSLCKKCSGANCNEPSKVLASGSCVQCDSSLQGNCVGRASSLDAEPCNDPTNTQCYTRMFSGKIERGCVSDLSATDRTKCSLGQDCHQCDATTQKCNTDIYPADRLSCYTCLAPPCNSHESVSLDVCQAYLTDDKCVTITDSSTGRPTRMGCMSALSNTEQSTCSSNSQACKQCTASGCNDPVNYAGASSCVQCSSSTDPDCIGGASAFVVQPCNDPLNFACYSRLTSAGVTERGCFSDLDSTSKTRCQAGTDCRMCSTFAKCNSLEYPIQIKCFQCDSTQNAECKNHQLGAPSYCPSYNAANKCFTVVQTNGDTVRECATGTRTETCGTSERCEECLYNGCNGRVSTDISSTVISTTTPAPRGAANGPLVTANLALLLMAAVTVRNMFMR